MSEPRPELPPPLLTPADLQHQVEAQAAELSRIRDQLQQEQAERRRTESLHRQWVALVQSSDDAIIGKTADGTIVTWNPGAERLFGYSTEEALGQSIDILTPIEQSQAMPAFMERIRLGEHVKHYETVRVRKDGTPVDVSLGISPIKDATDHIVGISTIARDRGGPHSLDKKPVFLHYSHAGLPNPQHVIALAPPRPLRYRHPAG